MINTVMRWLMMIDYAEDWDADEEYNDDENDIDCNGSDDDRNSGGHMSHVGVKLKLMC